MGSARQGIRQSCTLLWTICASSDRFLLRFAHLIGGAVTPNVVSVCLIYYMQCACLNVRFGNRGQGDKIGIRNLLTDAHIYILITRSTYRLPLDSSPHSGIYVTDWSF